MNRINYSKNTVLETVSVMKPSRGLFIANGDSSDIEKIKKLAPESLIIRTSLTDDLLEAIIDCRSIKDLTFKKMRMQANLYKFFRDGLHGRIRSLSFDDVEVYKKTKKIRSIDRLTIVNKINPEPVETKGLAPKEALIPIQFLDEPRKKENRVQVNPKKGLFQVIKRSRDLIQLAKEQYEKGLEFTPPEEEFEGTLLVRFHHYASAAVSMKQEVDEVDHWLKVLSESDDKMAMSKPLDYSNLQLKLKIDECKKAWFRFVGILNSTYGTTYV